MELTPNYQLPYPSAYEPPCEGAETFDLLGEAYDGEINRIDGELERLRYPYAAVVAYTSATPAVYPWGTGADPVPVLMDAVLYDRGGWADLGPFPDRLVVPADAPASGFYAVGAVITLAARTLGGTAFDAVVTIYRNGSIVVANSTAASFTTGETPLRASAPAVPAVPGDYFQVTISDPLNGAPNFTVDAARLWAFWLAG